MISGFAAPGAVRRVMKRLADEHQVMGMREVLAEQAQFAQAGNEFSLDSGGKVHIRCRKLPVTRKLLFRELARNNPEARCLGSHHLVVPDDWFVDLLEQYYGRSVTLDNWPENGEALAA